MQAMPKGVSVCYDLAPRAIAELRESRERGGWVDVAKGLSVQG